MDTSRPNQKKKQENRLFGEPDMAHHATLIKLADELDFKAAWIRDIPLYDPNFGDAAQVFEIFTYLGYLSSLTKNILLGTAAVVLPLRQPLLVKKAVQTVQYLSHNRLILGIASGDRPIEYPVFGFNFDKRAEVFRDGIHILKSEAESLLPQGLTILPKAKPAPLFVAGLAQQDPQWIGKEMDGWLSYPGTLEEHQQRVKLWRSVAGNKPYVSFLHLNLVADEDAPLN